MTDLTVTIRQGMGSDNMSTPSKPVEPPKSPEEKVPETDKLEPKDEALKHLEAALEALKKCDYNVTDVVGYIDMAITTLSDDEKDMPTKKADVIDEIRDTEDDE